MRNFLATAFSLLLCSSAMADIQMSVSDGDGGNSIFSSNGQKTRIEGGSMPGYVIIDSASGELFMVDPNRDQILTTRMAGGSADDAAVEISLKDKGGGRKIAGYLTRKYELTANGNSCGFVYASQELLQNPEVLAVFEAMRGLQGLSRMMTGGLGDLLTDCQRAGMQLGEVAQSSGAPLRVVDEKGKLVSEVRSVDTGQKFPGNHYELPTGIPVVDMTEQMGQAMEQNQQMMEKMPEMDELMKQIQQSGGEMTEEMQQQLQQMMKQMQQQ
jgi:hypothetical protein